MKDFDIVGWAYDGATYCTGCKPQVAKEDKEELNPIFAGSEWETYPTCDSCGDLIDEVSLIYEEAQFDRFTINMPYDWALSVSGPGDQYENVKEMAKFPHIASQLSALQPEDIRDELIETGGWSKEELEDEEENEYKILWIACNNIIDG